MAFEDEKQIKGAKPPRWFFPPMDEEEPPPIPPAKGLIIVPQSMLEHSPQRKIRAQYIAALKRIFAREMDLDIAQIAVKAASEVTRLMLNQFPETLTMVFEVSELQSKTPLRVDDMQRLIAEILPRETPFMTSWFTPQSSGSESDTLHTAVVSLAQGQERPKLNYLEHVSTDTVHI